MRARSNVLSSRYQLKLGGFLIWHVAADASRFSDGVGPPIGPYPGRPVKSAMAISPAVCFALSFSLHRRDFIAPLALFAAAGRGHRKQGGSRSPVFIWPFLMFTRRFDLDG